jgi:hypothetical protein
MYEARAARVPSMVLLAFTNTAAVTVEEFGHDQRLQENRHGRSPPSALIALRLS